MARLGFYQTDCETILCQIKHQEKQLQLKRRWLMGLPISKSKRKQLRGSKFLKYKSLPESLHREDDMFYESVEMYVKEALGAYSVDRVRQKVQDCLQSSDLTNIKGVLISCLDALTSKGLYLVARTLTGGTVKFERTRKKMKQVIKTYLPKESRNQNHNHRQKEILNKLSQLLNDLQNFRDNRVALLTPTFQSHRAAMTNVLCKLEELSSETLIAMNRKLRGVQGGMPRLQMCRHGWVRNDLISRIRKTCEKMLSELGTEDELQEPLAKAMAVAGLSLMLTPGWQECTATDFYPFSPGMKRLQNEIVKAIWMLKEKVRIQELKTLQHLLDPNAEVPNGCLRTAIKKMLTEYLFECNDLDSIPKSLLDALAVINRSSRSIQHGVFLKEHVEEEVECILGVSAQTRQIMWDLLPEIEFNQDFADAYMEELVDSDDDGDDNDDRQLKLQRSESSRSQSYDSDEKVESTCDSTLAHYRPFSTTKRKDSCCPLSPVQDIHCGFVEQHDPQHFTRVGSDPFGVMSSSQFHKSSCHNDAINTDVKPFQAVSHTKFSSPQAGGNCSFAYTLQHGSPNRSCIERPEARSNNGLDPGIPPDPFHFEFSFKDGDHISKKPSSCRNLYLTIQEVCDETSLVAYNLIGHLLEEFALEKDLNLDCTDSLYLRGGHSAHEDNEVAKEKKTVSEECMDSSVIVQIVEELLPTLPKSGIKRLEELMDSS